MKLFIIPAQNLTVLSAKPGLKGTLAVARSGQGLISGSQGQMINSCRPGDAGPVFIRSRFWRWGPWMSRCWWQWYRELYKSENSEQWGRYTTLAHLRSTLEQLSQSWYDLNPSSSSSFNNHLKLRVLSPSWAMVWDEDVMALHKGKLQLYMMRFWTNAHATTPSKLVISTNNRCFDTGTD